MNMKIQTAPELYAHAIAIEREAAERYAELAVRMQDEGREDLARIFQMLADLESEHLQTLEARTLDVALPQIPTGRYQWLDVGAPETAAHELVFRLMTPRMALAIALQAELRALAFFERVFMSCDDSALRALAREMAADEQEHAALLARILEETPDPAALASTPIFTTLTP
jgi:rubrerythrin